MDVIARFTALGRDDVAIAGGKGANLGELASAGLPVPPGFVITTRAYDEFVIGAGLRDAILTAAESVNDDADSADIAAATIAQLFASAQLAGPLAEEISSAYRELDGPVAVRSSATAEDLADASFAGQQDTYLNITGAAAVLDAVTRCWASLWTPRAIAYRRRARIAPDDVSLAVVVQRLVAADSAGVMFTANPSNGRRDELVISAAWGLGESVVSGTVSTDDVVLRRSGDSPTPATLRLQSRHTADKTVQTVRTPTGTAEVAVSQQRRLAEVLDDAAVIELGRLGERIQDHYSRPMDIEWARDSSGFHIVQARPVTALPEPVGDPPTAWPVEGSAVMYARTSITELLPDPLTPLFGDVVAPAVEAATHAVFDEMGAKMRPEDLSIPLINGYAYYRYPFGAFTRMGWSRLMPMFALMFSNRPGNARDRWGNQGRPAYAAIVERWKAEDPSELPAPRLLEAVDELVRAATVYYTTVQMIIPVAATSELTFARLYETMARQPGDPSATTFVLGSESEPMRAERELYDLGRWVADHPSLQGFLTGEDPRRACFGDRPERVDDAVWTSWRTRIDAYLDAFGHTVYNLDFANPVAADAPGPVLDTLLFYASGEAPDPAQRQRRQRSEREAATDDLLHRLGSVQRKIIEPVLSQAQLYAPIREDALADVGLAWPVVRRLLAELGRRLVAAEAITDPDDVYWLRLAELQRYAQRLDANEPLAPAGQRPAERRMRWRGDRSVTPPQLLPLNAVNRAFQKWMPSVADEQTGPVIRGLGASGGQVSAEAVLITEPSDFSKMRPGKVLVATITTPAYTPLFAMASAVVTDVGGPLSHSSIVAREYGIPAVLGTGVATQRITDGQLITVNGTEGTVRLSDDADEPDDHEHDAGKAVKIAAAAGAAVAGIGAVALLARRRATRHATR